MEENLESFFSEKKSPGKRKEEEQKVIFTMGQLEKYQTNIAKIRLRKPQIRN